MRAKRKKNKIQLTLNGDEAKLLLALMAAVTSTIGEHQEFVDAMREALKPHPKPSRWERPENLSRVRQIEST